MSSQKSSQSHFHALLLKVSILYVDQRLLVPEDITHIFLMQVVWKDSVRLGIGYARTANRTGVYVVARYKGHGNVPRQYNSQVTKPSYLFRTFQNNCYRECFLYFLCLL